jgi:hypothetical protein
MDKYAFGTNRARSFSLTIRAADRRRTLLDTRVEYVHQAFQRLIDWSIDEIGQDVCAAISGPDRFYTDHRIEASRDFAWIARRHKLGFQSSQCIRHCENLAVIDAHAAGETPAGHDTDRPGAGLRAALERKRHPGSSSIVEIWPVFRWRLLRSNLRYCS